MALPAFAAVRRAAAPLLLMSAVQQSIDRYLLPAAGRSAASPQERRAARE